MANYVCIYMFQIMVYEIPFDRNALLKITELHTLALPILHEELLEEYKNGCHIFCSRRGLVSSY